MSTPRSRSSSRPTAPASAAAGGQGGGHGRSTSAASSRNGGEGMEGAYVPPVHSSDADFDFCNAFWLTPQRSRLNGGREGDEGEEKDWGKEGVETLLMRVKTGSRGLEELRGVLKERASAAEDYSKRLLKLSRHAFGTGETGHLERAILTLKAELAQSAQSHTELASLMRGQEGMVAEFLGKREGGRKNQQTAIEKTWKQLQNQREHVLKAKAKYEQDAIQINALHAQASLLQGRELDKATLKLDKVQQTVAVNERDYRNYVAVLKETTVNWNMSWKTFCDLVQDQEEERLEFVKARLWDFANGLSTLAMAEDESAERTRTALEQCDPKIDVRIFVQQFGTGNAIPDPIPFHDVKSQTPAPKQAYRTARFQRSSTRIPGVRHSPSAVNDIASQIGRSAPPPPAGVQGMAATGRRPSQPDLQQPGGGARPPSRSANHASQSSLSATAAAPPPTLPDPVPPPSAARPAPSALQPDSTASPATSSRFAVSPSANLRASFNGGGSESGARPVSPGGTARPGHISAGAFQNRQSMVVSPNLAGTAPSPAAGGGGGTTVPARYEPPSSTVSSVPPPANAEQSKPSAAAAADEEDDDPLLKALKVLQNTPISEPPRPAAAAQNRMSQGPPPGGVSGQRSSVDLRGQAASPPQQQYHHQQHRSQASLSLAHAQPPPQQQYPSSRSRPSSPAPHAATMQAPPSSQPAPNAAAASYGQAFPGERSRPHSRAGSNVSAAAAARPSSVVGGGGGGAMLTSPPSVGNFGARPSSPGPNRGRSPSPQPFIPESLRPASPRPGMHGQPPQQQQQRAPSPSPQIQQQQQPVRRPTSGFGQSPSMGGYGQPQAPYGAPPPPQQAYAPPVQTQQQQQQQHLQQGFARSTSPQSPAPFAAYAPPPSQPQQQQPYMPPQQPSQHFPPQHHQPPQPYPHQHVLGANGYAYPVQQQQPQQAPPPSAQQAQYSQLPPPVGAPAPASAPTNAYAPPPQSQPQPTASHLARTASTHSGVSGASIQQTPMTAYQPQQQQRPTSVASVRQVQGGPPNPPPTGQYSDSGQPILFYVNALYDYAAASPEEFSFSTADVIAVTATDPDGWWQGFKVGSSEGSKLFPSNFTELLP